MSEALNQDFSASTVPVWGAKEISRVLNRPERAVYHALEAGKIPGAKKVAGRWMLIPARFFSSLAVA